MDLGKLAEKAKGLVTKRGGTDSLEKDAEELKDIAGSNASVSDKATAAAEPSGIPARPATAARASKASGESSETARAPSLCRRQVKTVRRCPEIVSGRPRLGASTIRDGGKRMDLGRLIDAAKQLFEGAASTA